MKKFYIATTLVFSLWGQTLSAEGLTQSILPDQSSFNVASGDSVKFSLVYKASEPDMVGVGVSLYFNAKKIQFLGFEGVKQESLLAADTKSKADESNKDNNNETDAMVTMAWLDISGKWPGAGQLPATLATAKFKVLDTADSLTTINILGDAAAKSILTTKAVSVKIGDEVLIPSSNTTKEPNTTPANNINTTPVATTTPPVATAQPTAETTSLAADSSNKGSGSSSGGGSFSYAFVFLMLLRWFKCRVAC